MGVELVNLTKRFGDVVAVDSINLNVENGSFTALLGPSGCGKTTTLRMIAGFESASAGSILLNGVDVRHLPPRKRNLGIVFQSYALFPHKTAFENVAYGLRMRRLPPKEVAARVRDALDLVKLNDYGHRKPNELSGGQQQRVAVARSIVTEPELLLFDEPLSNLDAKLRLDMRVEIRNLQKELGITTIFVTHDQEEALSLAEHIVVMNSGHIEQVGSPTAVYEDPATRFVGDFMGEGNWLKVTTQASGSLSMGIGTAELGYRLAPGSRAPKQGDDCVLLIRPEDVRLQRLPGDGIRGTVAERIYLGPLHEYRVQIPDGRQLRARAFSGTQDFEPGEEVSVSWEPQRTLLFTEDEARAT